MLYEIFFCKVCTLYFISMKPLIVFDNNVIKHDCEFSKFKNVNDDESSNNQ